MPACVILTYHIIDRPRSPLEAPYCCAPETFAAHMSILHEEGYTVIGLSDFLDGLDGTRAWPVKPVVVTIDDGISCAYEQALPVLARHGFPATVFMISGIVGRDNEWLLAQGFPRRRMLTSQEVVALDRAGIAIGSHSVSHPHLGRATADRVVSEVRDSKARLEDLLGKPVPLFSYPYGSFNRVAQDAVREAGYRTACATMPGLNQFDADRFALRRVSVAEDSAALFRRKVSHGMSATTGLKLAVRGVLTACRVLGPKSYA